MLRKLVFRKMSSSENLLIEQKLDVLRGLLKVALCFIVFGVFLKYSGGQANKGFLELSIGMLIILNGVKALMDTKIALKGFGSK